MHFKAVTWLPLTKRNLFWAGAGVGVSVGRGLCRWAVSDRNPGTRALLSEVSQVDMTGFPYAESWWCASGFVVRGLWKHPASLEGWGTWTFVLRHTIEDPSAVSDS